MNCDVCQIRLIELLDEIPAASATAEVRDHLDSCQVCRAYSAALHNLDGHLIDRAGTVLVPDGFKERLMAALPETLPRLLPVEIAERRRELEAGHQRALSRLRRQFLIPSPVVVLRSSAVVGGFVFAGLLAETLFRAIADGAHTPTGIDWALRSLVLGLSVAAGSFFLSRRTLVSVFSQILRTR